MKAMIANNPISETHTYFCEKSPRLMSVAWFGAIKPPSLRPIVVMNKPIPTPIARFRSCGIASNTSSRKPVITRMNMITPSRKMTAMPTCHGTLDWAKPMTL